MMSKIDWKLEKRSLSELQEYEDNPRDITKEGLKHLKASIDKFGCAEPLVINADGVICGGHGRKHALTELGIEEVDCYVPNRQLEEEEFKELNVRLNRNIAGEWNYDILANKFNQSKLIDWGFKKFEFTGGYSAETKSKEIDVDSSEEETSITLKYTGDDYLKFIEKVNRLRNNGETYEAFFMRMLDVSL
jgi:site-specific DNA-methyltransferase (adenine-specific)